MEDQNILDLYFHRSEQAITETDRKYGGYCYTIAYNILGNREDSEESVSDTYMAAWNAIPPKRPDILSAFLAKLTRHISIDHWRKSSAKKRGGGEIVLALEELDNCIGAGGTITPLPWFNVVLTSGYAWNVSATDGDHQNMAQTVRTATQRLSLNFYVTRQITLNASVEDNYNNLAATNRHAWFGDVSAKYKLKRIDLELQANNLFNQKQYTRVNYSGLDIYTQTSQLRPCHILETIRFKLL